MWTKIQPGSVHQPLEWRTSQQLAGCCWSQRQFERRLDHRLVQRVNCATDLVAPLVSAISSTTVDQAALATPRDAGQHAAAARVGHAVLNQPPVPQNAAAAQKQLQQSNGSSSQLLKQHKQQLVVVRQHEHVASSTQLQQQRHNSLQPAPNGTNRNGKPGSTSGSGPAARPARSSHRRFHTTPPLKFKPCDRGGGLKHATAISQHLTHGRQVLLPAGSGMQVARGVAALASARTLMLSHSGATGLAFQPSFSSAAAAAAAAEGQQGRFKPAAVQQQEPSSSSSSKGSVSSIMLFATGLPEAQLRRFEQQPLVAARYGNTATLTAAVFARVCQQGYTSLCAAGPDAVAVALHAVTDARRQLLGVDLDMAVVPATEFVDVESLAASDAQHFTEYEGDEGDLDGGEDSYRQLVRVTVLHVMRCEPQQPWKLLPWRPEQQPAERLRSEPIAQLQQQPQQWQEEEQLLLAPGAEQQSSKQQGQRLGGTEVLLPPTFSSSSTNISSNISSSSSGLGIDSSPWSQADKDACETAVSGDDVEVLKLQVSSHGAGVVARQAGALLLQKQRKSKRQLVAAAQASHANGGSCSS